MKKNLFSVLKILIYLSFFVPLLPPSASFIFPFIVPKILLFRSLVTLMLGVYGLLLLINWKEFRPRLNAVSVAVGGFLVSFTLSTFLGVDPYHSFWDNHERMLGLFTIFHYVAYFFIAGAILKTRQDWQRALKIFSIVGSVVVMGGIIQKWINPSFLLGQGSDRVYSTLGNAIYLAGYGLFLFFINILLFSWETIRSWKWLEITSAGLGVLGIFISGTRGTLLALVIGVFIMLVWYAIALKEHARLRRWFGVVAIGCVAFSLLFVSFRNSAFIQKIPGVNRLARTSVSEIVSGPRIIAWQIAWQSLDQHPLFGWGPNNFIYAFNKFYNPRSLSFGAGETWFDNAHNAVMNTLAVQGWVGLIAYVGLFIASMYTLVRNYRRNKTDKHLLIIGNAFFISHFLHNLTVFENPSSYLYFMLWLALCYRSMFSADEAVDVRPDRNQGIFAWGIVGTATLLFLVVFNLQPARANQQVLRALKLFNSGIDQGLPAMQSAFDFKSPHIDDIRTDIGRAVEASLSESVLQKNPEIFELIVGELRKNIQLHPLDIRNQLLLDQLYESRARLTNNAQDLVVARDFLEQALELSPRRQQIIFNIAFLDLNNGKKDQAIKMLEDITFNSPPVAESYRVLMYAYVITGQPEKARETLDRARDLAVVFDGQQESFIASQILPAITSGAATSSVR